MRVNLPSDPRQEKVRALTVEPLKRLRPWHRQLVKLHLQGLARDELAEACDCTPARVTQLLADPLIRQELEREYSYQEEQLRALGGSAVRAVREALADEDPEVRLKAARLQLETQGRLRRTATDGSSAEDAVAKIIQFALQVNITQSQHATPTSPPTGALIDAQG